MKMGRATGVIAHLALAAVGISCAVFARAETLLDQNVMVSTSTGPKVDPLSFASTGKLSITVSDLQWPQALSSLSFTISNTTTVLARWAGVGRLDFDVISPGALFATVFASPDSSVGVGLYHINVAFAAGPVGPTVPLPASMWLLLSGVCGFAALRGKHATVTNSIVQ